MLGQMGPTVAATTSAKGAAARMMWTLAEVPTIDNASDAGEIPTGTAGEFKLQAVKFRYPTRPDVPLFEGLDLLIPGGKTTALVGESGSGKSTVSDPAATDLTLSAR